MSSWLKVFGYMVLVAIGLYLFFLITLYTTQRKAIFPGSGPVNFSESGLSNFTEVTYQTEDGLTLTGWYHPPASGKPTIIHYHGNASSLIGRSHIAKLEANWGYGVLLTTYRGFSGIAGSPSESNLYKDARASFKFLATQNIKPETIILHAESLGTGIAVQMATEYPVKAIILEAPYTSIIDVAANRFPYFPVRAVMLDKFDSISKIKQVHAPLLLIMGERDNVIPPKFGHELYKAANQPKQELWLPDAQHYGFYEYPEVPLKLKAFLAAL